LDDADTGGDDAAPGDAGGGDDAIGDDDDASDDSGSGDDAGGSDDGGDDAGDDAATAGDDAGSGTTQALEMTFYGWDDNSPPGNAIAYPKNAGYPTVHDGAGGTGTYADPITFASDPNEFPVGTIVYAAVIDKYLVMEDACGQCETDWTSGIWHIDVWMNSNGTENADDLFHCEDQWTQSTTSVVIGPPDGLTVTTAPLFDPSTNACRTTP